MTHEIVEIKNMLRVKLCHAIHSIENGRTTFLNFYDR